MSSKISVSYICKNPKTAKVLDDMKFKTWSLMVPPGSSPSPSHPLFTRKGSRSTTQTREKTIPWNFHITPEQKTIIPDITQLK